MSYLAWYDADRKKPAHEKIKDAYARYQQKFGRHPLVCLCNPADAPVWPQVGTLGVEVRPLAHIGVNCFWIGRDDEPEATP